MSTNPEAMLSLSVAGVLYYVGLQKYLTLVTCFESTGELMFTNFPKENLE